MRALSIRSPYAEEIMAGAKRVENRSWLPPEGVGRIAVHRCGKDGAIIGTIEVAEVITWEEALERYPEQDDYIAGPWCWVLRDPRPCEPIPCKGRLNLWHLPEGIVLD